MRALRTVAAVIGGAVMIALSACSGSAPTAPTSDGSVPSAQAETPSESPAATGPEPGSAEALLARFQAALTEADAASDAPDGDSVVEALVAAGFDRSTIERTSDVDSVGGAVTLLEVAVQTSDACLIGQVGDGTPTSMIAPVLGTGRCLVGATVPVG